MKRKDNNHESGGLAENGQRRKINRGRVPG
jgi:hypothetical protein